MLVDATGTGATGSASVARMTKRDRRAQLLEVAENSFGTAGYHATSMNDLAAAAGITKPVLYRHFPSKRELYLAVLDDCCARLLNEIVKATADAPTPHEQVSRGFLAYFTFVVHHQPAFTVLFTDAAGVDAELHEPVRALKASIATTIATLIHADIDDAHRRMLSVGIVAMAEGMGQLCVAEGLTIDPAKLAQQAADLAWAGLRIVKRI